ncbi:Hypp4144 [Branchiostoma lanceolatum]|uniref:Hypp4144 protein n=1 Tax=Branchiostoma lanceolatum TaxID=7740 RepID=A0A8K0A8C7_BRALA|nr:Hypp4144 [Branchiostoma lanceolatum]
MFVLTLVPSLSEGTQDMDGSPYDEQLNVFPNQNARCHDTVSPVGTPSELQTCSKSRETPLWLFPLGRPARGSLAAHLPPPEVSVSPHHREIETIFPALWSVPSLRTEPRPNTKTTFRPQTRSLTPACRASPVCGVVPPTTDGVDAPSPGRFQAIPRVSTRHLGAFFQSSVAKRKLVFVTLCSVPIVIDQEFSEAGPEGMMIGRGSDGRTTRMVGHQTKEPGGDRRTPSGRTKLPPVRDIDVLLGFSASEQDLNPDQGGEEDPELESKRDSGYLTLAPFRGLCVTASGGERPVAPLCERFIRLESGVAVNSQNYGLVFPPRFPTSLAISQVHGWHTTPQDKLEKLTIFPPNICLEITVFAATNLSSGDWVLRVAAGQGQDQGARAP